MFHEKHEIIHDEDDEMSINQDYVYAEEDCEPDLMQSATSTTKSFTATSPLPSEIPHSESSALPQDPLKLFFDAMYASVRQMSKPDILHIRRKLFDLVSEVEEVQEYPLLDQGEHI